MSPQVQAITDELDKLLTDKQFNKFLYKKGYTTVISGEDEAVYDWVTVNFLKGAFSGKSKAKTYGALDMGGASHQNAFKVRTCCVTFHVRCVAFYVRCVTLT